MRNLPVRLPALGATGPEGWLLIEARLTSGLVRPSAVPPTMWVNRGRAARIARTYACVSANGGIPAWRSTAYGPAL